MSGKIGKLLATFALEHGVTVMETFIFYFLSDNRLYCLTIYSNYEVYNLNKLEGKC